MLITILFSSGILFSQESDFATKKARAVIERAIEAKGGQRLLTRFPAWHFKYREKFVRKGKETIEAGEVYEHLARRQARYESPPNSIIVVNGSQGWIKNADKVTALTSGQLADFHDYLCGKEAMLTLLPLLSEDWRISSQGAKDVAGKPAEVIRIRRKNGWTATTYWDQKTLLLVKAEYPHKRLVEPDDAKRRASVRESVFADYRALSGVMLHSTVRVYSAGKYRGEAELFDIELLKELPRSVLQMAQQQ